jgi:methylmalonyl-CoA/ethylmalonyl-CoA epimerase
MKIKRIEHIAIALKNMDALKSVLSDKLGVPMEYEETLPAYRTKLAMYPIGETSLELLQSDQPDGLVNNWIAERGEGLFHICLEVDDIDAAMAELKGKGMRFQQEEPREGHGGSRIAFLDPACTEGLVIELAQLPEGGHGHHGHQDAAE